jgi:hypothetical protein
MRAPGRKGLAFVKKKNEAICNGDAPEALRRGLWAAADLATYSAGALIDLAAERRDLALWHQAVCVHGIALRLRNQALAAGAPHEREGGV